MEVCEKKIAAWLDKRSSVDQTVKSNASIRYIVLKEARGKCQLCGISAEVRPIDIDHIVPRSKADKHGKIRLNGWPAFSAEPHPYSRALAGAIPGTDCG